MLYLNLDVLVSMAPAIRLRLVRECSREYSPIKAERGYETRYRYKLSSSFIRMSQMKKHDDRFERREPSMLSKIYTAFTQFLPLPL